MCQALWGVRDVLYKSLVLQNMTQVYVRVEL